MSNKLQIINGTGIDLGSKTPFAVGVTAIAMNLTAGTLVVQTSDDGVTYGPAAPCGASPTATAMQEVLLKRFVRVSTAATMFIIGDL